MVAFFLLYANEILAYEHLIHKVSQIMSLFAVNTVNLLVLREILRQKNLRKESAISTADSSLP